MQINFLFKVYILREEIYGKNSNRMRIYVELHDECSQAATDSPFFQKGKPAETYKIRRLGFKSEEKEESGRT